MKVLVLRKEAIHPEQARRYALAVGMQCQQGGPGEIKISQPASDGCYYVVFEEDRAAELFESYMDGRRILYTRIDCVPPNVSVVNIASASVTAAFVEVTAALQDYYERRRSE